LVNLSIILSPFLPFISEEIYTNLTGNQSVHLENWPSLISNFNPPTGGQISNLVEDMKTVRKVSEVGRRVRKELKLKLRQPLAATMISLAKSLSFNNKQNQQEYNRLLESELNVKKIVWSKPTKQDKIKVSFNSQLTPGLIREGELRELVRQIQSERKKLNINPNQPIKLTIPKKFSQDSGYLKKKVVADKITYGSFVKIVV